MAIQKQHDTQFSSTIKANYHYILDMKLTKDKDGDKVFIVTVRSYDVKASRTGGMDPFIEYEKTIKWNDLPAQFETDALQLFTDLEAAMVTLNDEFKNGVIIPD